MMSGLSARYNADDCASSSDCSAWSLCNSPPESPFQSPEHCASSPVQSLEGTTASCHTSPKSSSAGACDETLSDSSDNATAERDHVSRREEAGNAWSVGTSHVHSSRNISTPPAPLRTSFNYNSSPTTVRRNKQQRVVQTALRRNIAKSLLKDSGRKMSVSTEEVSTKSQMPTTSSSPDLTEGVVFQLYSRPSSEMADRRRTREINEDESRSVGFRGSIVAQVGNSFRQHFSADSKRRRRRVSKHLFSGTAESGEPQLVGLRRLCDDYRTSCLQQNLDARRTSLNRMLSNEFDQVTVEMPALAVEPQDESVAAVHQLNNVVEERPGHYSSSSGCNAGASAVVTEDRCLGSCPPSSVGFSSTAEDLHSEVCSPVSSEVFDDSVSVVRQPSDIDSVSTVGQQSGIDTVSTVGQPGDSTVSRQSDSDGVSTVGQPSGIDTVITFRQQSDSGNIRTVGQPGDEDKDLLKSCTPVVTSISMPTDDMLCIEFESRTSYDDEVDHNTSERLDDILEDSVGSCTTMTSILSMTSSRVAGGCVDGCTTVVNTATDVPSFDEGRSHTLRAVDDRSGVDVEQLIDVDGDSYDGYRDCESSAVTFATTASDLLVLLNTHSDTSEEIICRDECVCDDDQQMSPRVEDSLHSCTRWAAADDMLRPLAVQSSASDEVWPVNDGHTTSNAVVTTSADDLINFSQTSSELAGSFSRELSENCSGDVLDSHTANTALVTAASAEVDSEISPESSASEIQQHQQQQQVNDGEQQCGITASSAALSRTVLVSDRNEETWL